MFYLVLQKKSSDNETRIQTLEDLNIDYKKQVEALKKRNDALCNEIKSFKPQKRRKKTTSTDIEDDEDILTDNELNKASHSQNLFEDSSLQVLSPRNESTENTSNRKSMKTPTKPEAAHIFKTPKKVSPPEPHSSDSNQKRVLALYSPKSKKLIVSPSKNLPKRVPLSSGWVSTRSGNGNLKNSMSFINFNKENKALIQSRLVFPRTEGNSLILDSGEETFCEEIQSSQKSPGPRHNKSKRLK